MTTEHSEKIKYRIWFSRWGYAKYLSQHDTSLILQQTFRRANLPVSLSGKFNPRMKISFFSSLPVGIASQGEPMDVFFSREVSCIEILEKLQNKISDCMSVQSVEKIQDKQKYWLDILYKVKVYPALKPEKASELMGQKNILVHRSKIQKKVDIRPFLQEVAIEDGQENNSNVWIKTRLTFQGSASIWEILELLGVSLQATIEITREKIHLHPVQKEILPEEVPT